jgi:hypothetical protein
MQLNAGLQAVCAVPRSWYGDNTGGNGKRTFTVAIQSVRIMPAGSVGERMRLYLKRLPSV